MHIAVLVEDRVRSVEEVDAEIAGWAKNNQNNREEGDG